MEMKLDYNYILPLKEFSLRRFAAILCCQSDILSLLDQSDVEYKVVDNISKLELPSQIINQIKNLVKHIELEIRNWKKFHTEYLEIGDINILNLMRHLCWTNLGTVDYRQTAEKIIHLETLDTLKGYKLACLYCLDEYIPSLWGKLSEEDKNYFLKERKEDELKGALLEFCWPYILKGKETKLDYLALNAPGNSSTFIELAFEYSAYSGNKAAAEYFLRKLPFADKESFIMAIANEVSFLRKEDLYSEFRYEKNGFPVEKISDIFCYLTSLMKPQQQIKVLKDLQAYALLCFLDWPWIDLFWDIVELIWDCLDSYSFCLVLEHISKVKSEFHRVKLFRDFYLRGSSDFIKEFANDMYNGNSVLDNLFEAEDTKTIELIISKLDDEDRKKLPDSWEVFRVFYKSLIRDRYSLVELFFREASLSEDDMYELINGYGTYITLMSMEDGGDREDYVINEFLCLFNSLGAWRL